MGAAHARLGGRRSDRRLRSAQVDDHRVTVGESLDAHGVLRQVLGLKGAMAALPVIALPVEGASGRLDGLVRDDVAVVEREPEPAVAATGPEVGTELGPGAHVDCEQLESPAYRVV